MPYRQLQILKISGLKRKKKKKKQCLRYKTSTNRYVSNRSTYDWVPGLSGAPDEPHAVHVSFMTEGNGVGVTKEPPVDANTLESLSSPTTTARLCFKISLTANVEVNWDTVLVDRKLYIEIPASILPDGSRESFVTLLEYAEETLHCSHVIVCFKKERVDRTSLIRTFMYMGFVVVPPCSPMAPKCSDALFMAYTIDEDDDDDDEG